MNIFHIKVLVVQFLCCCVLSGCLFLSNDANASYNTAPADKLRERCLVITHDLIEGPIQIIDRERVPSTLISPEYCKLTVAFTGTDLKFSLWLPVEQWNNRMVFLGGGGFDGSMITVESFEWILSPSVLTEHYALVSTNGGHDQPFSDPNYFKAEFAADAEALADFTYRSEHRSLPHAKRLITEFYGRAPKYTYFEGCSMGGHDALILSQRYPQDFDGIIARAPAGNIVGQFQQFHRIGSLVSNSASVLSVRQRNTLASAVLEQCDNLDGLIDGIIANPDVCQFDVSTLGCIQDSVDDCLSDMQLDLINAITTPLINDKGEIIHPGYQFGGGNKDYGWGEYIWPKESRASWQMLFSEGFIRAFITGDSDYNTSTWDAKKWQPELDKVKAIFDAVDPNIREFSRNGGKLIMWNGTLDTSVSYRDSVRYYNAVISALGKKNTDQVLEFFLAPGVAHCGGGNGPDRVDLLQALSTWVELGTPPSEQNLTLTKSNDQAEVVLSRPMCKYPLYARYKGKGDTRQAESFTCEDP